MRGNDTSSSGEAQGASGSSLGDFSIKMNQYGDAVDIGGSSWSDQAFATTMNPWVSRRW